MVQHRRPAVHRARSRVVRFLRDSGEPADGARGIRRARRATRRNRCSPSGEAHVRVPFQGTDRELMARPTARTLSLVDINFIGTALVIMTIGCVLLYSATYFSDPSLDLLRKQMLWAAIGIALMAVFPSIDYPVFFDIAPFLYAIGNLLLLYLLIWGRVTANVKSWIHIGTFQFQPSEFMKIFTALMLARYFDNHSAAYLDGRAFLRVALIIG